MMMDYRNQPALLRLVFNEFNFDALDLPLWMGRLPKPGKEMPIQEQQGTFLPLSASKNVSRKHAQIFWEGFGPYPGHYIICESRNGIRVNDQILLPEYGPMRLDDRSRIQIGDHAFYVLLPSHIV